MPKSVKRSAADTFLKVIKIFLYIFFLRTCAFCYGTIRLVHRAEGENYGM